MNTDPATPPAPGRLLLTPVEAAATLGISRSTLYVLLARGDIASVHIGASRRVPVSALHAYAQQISDPADGHTQACPTVAAGAVHRSP